MSAADRTAMIAARLKKIYQKAVLPCEKRYRYDYFYESPFLSDVEFDGTLSFWLARNAQWHSKSLLEIAVFRSLTTRHYFRSEQPNRKFS